MGEIMYDLADSLRLHLQDKMVDDIPAAYSTTLAYTDSEGDERTFAPSLIKIGRLQDDPTALSEDTVIPSSYVAIHAHDPLDTSDGWKHSIASSVESSTTNLSLGVGYPYELGGSKKWWRRLVAEFGCYFIDSDQSETEAFRLANVMRGLLEHYCESYRADNLHGWNCVLTDDFGESALEAHVAKSHCWEGGGPDDDYIWRGAVWVQVFTVKE